MAYELIYDKNIDLTRLGYKDASVQMLFNKDNSCLCISLFDGGHYLDEIYINLEGEFGFKEGFAHDTRMGRP
jgi:hypothetical protein